MSETKKIPQRSDIAPADQWAIEDLYATDEAWSADLELSLIHISEPTRH